MGIATLLFFILMPLVYVGISIIIYSGMDVWYWARTEYKALAIWCVFELIIYYGIEISYAIICKKMLGYWIFSNNPAVHTGYVTAFVVCAIMFIVCHLFVCGLTAWEAEFVPFSHLILLIILYVVFVFIAYDINKDAKDKEYFNNLQYEMSTEEISLVPLSSDENNTLYIKGTTNIFYQLYYSYKDEDGNTVMRSIEYSDNIKIQENDIYINDPKFIIHHYYKSYKELYSEYYTYEIHIPTNSMDKLTN